MLEVAGVFISSFCLCETLLYSAASGQGDSLGVGRLATLCELGADVRQRLLREALRMLSLNVALRSESADPHRKVMGCVRLRLVLSVRSCARPRPPAIDKLTNLLKSLVRMRQIGEFGHVCVVRSLEIRNVP